MIISINTSMKYSILFLHWMQKIVILLFSPLHLCLHNKSLTYAHFFAWISLDNFTYIFQNLHLPFSRFLTCIKFQIWTFCISSWYWLVRVNQRLLEILILNVKSSNNWFQENNFKYDVTHVEIFFVLWFIWKALSYKLWNSSNFECATKF